MRLVLLKGVTSPLNTAGLKVNTYGCRLWRLNSRSVSIIVAQSPPAALAAKAATANIAIVFVVGFDPVGAGLVADLSNPGGNATGMTLISNILGQKRLEMVRDL